MPLIKSASRKAIGANIQEMEAAGRPRDQAIAASLRNARQYGARMASGGAPSKLAGTLAQKEITHEGFLHSSVPGRTDKLPISVSGGSYVLPADHVAAVGQGNSLAGANIVNRLFKMGPYGSTRIAAHGMRAPRQKRFADGGGTGEPTDIIAAGGEIVIPPESIMDRFGDLDHGHRALDKWVLDTRQKHIKTLRGLKPPKKD